MTTHYDTLGVSPQASAVEIRHAYRDLARRVHPDNPSVHPDPAAMAAVNEAYRVLSEPGRRALYDRSLGDAAGPAGPPDDERGGDLSSGAERHTILSPAGPARVPWRLMLVLAAIGTGVVLVAAALADPPDAAPPDGILTRGSCVEIEPNGDAREIACGGDTAVVVEVLVPLDATCPAGTVGHRDRLGLGIACVSA